MDFESEVFFNCPYCHQNISVLLEKLYGSQSYIEDCEVCCNPIQVSYQIEDGKIIQIHATRAQE